MKWIHKVLSLILAACVVLAAGAVPVQAAETAQKDDSTVRLIVEMEEEAVMATAEARAMGAVTYAGTEQAVAQGQRLVAAQSSVQSTIRRRINADAQVGYTYTNVINGFSLDASISDIAKIKAIDGVKNVYVVGQSQLPEPVEAGNTVTADTESGVLSCCEQIHASEMHTEGYDGRGQVIAVIDSELDVNHEFFSGEVADPKLTLENIKTLLAENNFNVNVSAKRVYHSSKLPFVYDYYNDSADTYDLTNVHGTHVTGIAAGKDGSFGDTTFSGVAPEAQVVFMKVANESGYLDNAVVLAAFDDAAKLGVCAVNASFGSSYTGDAELFATAMKNLREAGVLVSAAAGNDSRGVNGTVYSNSPDYDTSAFPNKITEAMSVAASEVPSVITTHYEMILGDGQTEVFTSAGQTNDFIQTFSETAWEYVYCGRADVSDVKDLDLTGRIAVVLRDTPEIAEKLTFSEKAQNVEAKGAAGIIFVNYEEELVTPLTETELPYVLVMRSLGDALLAQTSKTIQINPEPVICMEENANTGICSFSSWGTDYSLELKPEITAPGGNIYSAVPDDGYGNDSGTSMAAPHVTGATAVLSQYLDEYFALHPDVDLGNRCDVIQNLMMTSAKLIYQDNGLPASPRQQGAGLLNLQAAVNTPVLVTGTENKAKISLGELEGSSYTLSFTAKNFTDQTVTYTPSLYVFTDDAVLDAEEGRYIVTGSKTLGYTADLPESITIPAHSEKEIQITVDLRESQLKQNLEVFSNGFFVDGFVVLTPSDDSAELSIPYTGFYGDWNQIPAFGSPYFAYSDGQGDMYLAAYGQEYGCQNDGVGGDFCTPLGVNQLYSMLVGMELDLSEYDGMEFRGEQFAGYSPNGDGSMDSLCAMIKPLRAVDTLQFVIRDATGEIIYDTENIGMKYYWQCFDYENSLPDGDYTVEFRGAAAVEGAKTESQTLRFYVDTDAPMIEDLQLREQDGSVYLDLSLTDNRYLMYASVWSEQDADMEGDASLESDGDPLSGVRLMNTASAEATFDVTGMDLESIWIELADYAGNVVSVQPWNDPFEDVEREDYFYDAVLWAVKRGITQGTSDTTFDPGQNCSRAEAMTFLWRAAGCPEPESGEMPFTDVPEDAYYRSAVLWAVEQGITTGTTDTTFSPDADCSRGEAMTFLWRVTGCPEPEGTDQPFSDAEPGSYYEKAVLWAVERGITIGTSDTTFSPETPCNRAQIVTFLYRYGAFG